MEQKPQYLFGRAFAMAPTSALAKALLNILYKKSCFIEKKRGAGVILEKLQFTASPKLWFLRNGSGSSR